MRAFLWDQGRLVNLGIFPGAEQSVATRINDAGQIIGLCMGEKNGGGFLWENGQMKRLPTLPGCDSTEPKDINNRGQIVVSSCKAVVGPPISPAAARQQWRAFLYARGLMIRLDDLLPRNSGWTLLDATGINDRGQIVGYGINRGRQRPFLMTVRSDASPSDRK